MNNMNSNMPIHDNMMMTDTSAYQPIFGYSQDGAPIMNRSDMSHYNNVYRKYSVPTYNNTSLAPMNNNMNMQGTNTSNSESLMPETLTNTAFLPGYLNQHLGRWVRVESLIGDELLERVGILREVGASYIILQAIEPATIVVLDMYSIKSVTIVLDNEFSRLFYNNNGQV